MKRRLFVNAGDYPRERNGLLYGQHAISAWLDTRPTRVCVLRHQEVLAPRQAMTVAAARARGVRVEAAQRRELGAIAGTAHHQGLVAEVTPFPYVPPQQILGSGAAMVVLADHIQDPRNLGAILRTAEAVGAGGVLLPADGAVGVTATVEAGAAGAAARLPVGRVTNVVRALEHAKAAGYWAVGLTPGHGVDLYSADLPNRVAVVVGGEEGLRPLVAKSCDWRVFIPMSGRAESLNASVAAAVVLYELYRRSRTP